MNSGIYNMDCMEAMKEFPDNFFELAIVDPPYVQGKRGRTFTSTNKNLTGNYKTARLNHGNKTKIDLGKQPNKKYFKELFRISRNQIIFGMQFFTPHLPPNQCCIIWDKCQGEGMTFSEFELMWTSFETRTRIFRRHPLKDRLSVIHPTQKPIDLYRWLLMNYAKEGDKIVDTHMGSGSSVIACNRLGYEVWAYEIDKDYFEDAKKRIDLEKTKLTLF